MTKGRPRRVTNDEIQKKNHFDHFHQLLASKSSRLEGDWLRPDVAELPLGDRSAHTKLPVRGQHGPLWARVTAPRHGMVVRQFMLLPGSHVCMKRVGWKTSGWSRGQKVSVPAQCLVEIARTDLDPLKQTLSSRFQLDVRHPNIFLRCGRHSF